jgi:chromosome partitioning protein
MSATIAISNQKGGVGKTTTCHSLGAALAETGHAVLLIDLDPQANLTLSLGLQPQDLRRTIIDSLMGTSSLLGVSSESDVFALDIVPANHELALVDKVLYRLPGFHYRLKQALDRIQQEMYDYVLLDCPPSLAPLTINALSAAELLIIPVQCEFYATHDLGKVVGLARKIGRKVNPDLDHRVLVTLYDQRNKISRIMLEEIQNRFGDVLLKTIIQIDTKLREAPAFGQPITSYAPRSRGAEQYRALARELSSLDSSHLIQEQESSIEREKSCMTTT